MSDGLQTPSFPGWPAENPRDRRPTRRSRVLEWLVSGVIVAVLIAPLLPSVQQSGGGSYSRARCRNHLKFIALALHKYHDAHGHFPPAYIADADGRPLHSWRVLILPYLDLEEPGVEERPSGQELYDRYRFDEPWDGANNRLLHDEIVPIFKCPSEGLASKSHDRRMTSYVAVVGDETAWPGERTTKIADFEDGLPNTLLLVEIADSGIHWMEPRDLRLDVMPMRINPAAGQGISSRHKGGAEVLRADGTVRYLAAEGTSADTLRGLFTIRGGEPVPNDF